MKQKKRSHCEYVQVIPTQIRRHILKIMSIKKAGLLMLWDKILELSWKPLFRGKFFIPSNESFSLEQAELYTANEN